MSEETKTRYSILQTPDIEMQKKIAIDLLNFFNVLNAKKIHAQLGLQVPSSIVPFSILQFFEWVRKDPGREVYERMRFQIIQLAKTMARFGFLSFEGKGRSGIFGDGDTYFAVIERSTGASHGTLFLGKALGPAYIAHELHNGLVAISGLDASGDISVGTGIHVHPSYIVTCDHVIRDMTIDRELVVNGVTVKVIACPMTPEPGIDVGAIRFDPPVPLALPDLMFRDAVLLEEVLVAGFPTVPTAIERFATFQRGEICQTNVPTIYKTDVDLFSAIARPGNSGGPLVSTEGNIVGLVTQSLEREKESADRLKVLPFFAAVPASDVRKQFEALTGEQLPWETYQ